MKWKECGLQVLALPNTSSVSWTILPLYTLTEIGFISWGEDEMN